MNIGIAKENRPSEKRVILRPQELKDIVMAHNVFVEEGAGEGIGIKNSSYRKAGAKIVSRKEVYGKELVVRIKKPKEEELALMKPGAAIFSMLHLPGNPVLRQLLKKYKIIAISMEEIKDCFGKRKIEALHQAGYIGMEQGFKLWGRPPSECLVKIMGYGNVACGAIQCAARKLARVGVLNKRDFKNMREHIPGTDILINAINWPVEKRGKEFIITRDMLKLFKKGAVILDLISNPVGQSPIETMHPTSLDNIFYKVEGVIHTSCWGWPGFDPVNISQRYSIQVAPVLREIADSRINNLPQYIKVALHKEF
ncbi:MAG: hypothetical protein JSV34_01750 [Candidatus Omnitrophota bacterium]|nr:MAG: hypothetical protein JSV34_01750 [Candidatus Omnitrophota bacterium]